MKEEQGFSLTKEAYEQSLLLLKRCISSGGFLASPTEKDNYRRVFARDAAVMGVAALATEDEELIETTRRSIATLAEHQGEHGEIPSNVDIESGAVSYGGTTGRVDAALWFIIIAALYFKKTKDSVFLNHIRTHLEKVMWLLGAWEFNQKGFIYVPETGDWADEYIQEGYVLYDQVLYYRAMQSYIFILELAGSDSSQWKEKRDRLGALIRSNFGFCLFDEAEDVYHPILREHGMNACDGKEYWMPYFAPSGYGDHFATFANILVSLVGVAAGDEANRVDSYIENAVAGEETAVLPVNHPVILPTDKKWNRLESAYAYNFKNKPHEYHNGGRWPMVTGFYVLDLARRGEEEKAGEYLEAIQEANKTGREGQSWGFHEFLHGESGEPMGTRHQGWSGAAGVIAHHAIYQPHTVLF